MTKIIFAALCLISLSFSGCCTCNQHADGKSRTGTDQTTDIYKDSIDVSLKHATFRQNWSDGDCSIDRPMWVDFKFDGDGSFVGYVTTSKKNSNCTVKMTLSILDKNNTTVWTSAEFTSPACNTIGEEKEWKGTFHDNSSWEDLITCKRVLSCSEGK